MGALERKAGGPDNWVEAAGGLPAYIERIAKSLHEKRGFTISRAIATAVSMCKRWAAGGEDVNPDTRAKAAAAIADWEAKRARAATKRAVDLSTGHVDLADLVDLATADAGEQLGTWTELDVIDLTPGDYKAPYDWKHGFIPLTPAAAAVKAKKGANAGKGRARPPRGATPGKRSGSTTGAPKQVAGRKPAVVDAQASPSEAQQRMVRALSDAELRAEVNRKSSKPATRAVAQAELDRRAKARDDESRGRAVPGEATPPAGSGQKPLAKTATMRAADEVKARERRSRELRAAADREPAARGQGAGSRSDVAKRINDKAQADQRARVAAAGGKAPGADRQPDMVADLERRRANRAAAGATDAGKPKRLSLNRVHMDGVTFEQNENGDWRGAGNQAVTDPGIVKKLEEAAAAPPVAAPARLTPDVARRMSDKQLEAAFARVFEGNPDAAAVEVLEAELNRRDAEARRRRAEGNLPRR